MYCIFVGLNTNFFVVGVDIRRQFSIEEEDDLLQFAIQQSIIDAGTEREEVSFVL